MPGPEQSDQNWMHELLQMWSEHELQQVVSSVLLLGRRPEQELLGRRPEQELLQVASSEQFSLLHQELLHAFFFVVTETGVGSGAANDEQWPAGGASSRTIFFGH